MLMSSIEFFYHIVRLLLVLDTVNDMYNTCIIKIGIAARAGPRMTILAWHQSEAQKGHSRSTGPEPAVPILLLLTIYRACLV